MFRNSAILCQWYGCCPTGSTLHLRQCSECTCEAAKRLCLRLRRRGLRPSARLWRPRWSRTRLHLQLAATDVAAAAPLQPVDPEAATLVTAQRRGKTPPKRKTRSAHLPRPFLGNARGVNPGNPIFGNVPCIFLIFSILYT